jgi:flagellar motor switch protein FliN
MAEPENIIKLIGDALVRGDADYSRLLNVHANISIVLGQKKVTLREISKIGVGSIVELDRMLGEPVDLYVNDEPFAEGEIVVVNDRYGLRIIAIHGVDTPEEEVPAPVSPSAAATLFGAATPETSAS